MEGTKRLVFECTKCKEKHSIEVKRTPNPLPNPNTDDPSINQRQRPAAGKKPLSEISISESWDWEDSLFKDEDSLINLINKRK